MHIKESTYVIVSKLLFAFFYKLSYKTYICFADVFSEIVKFCSMSYHAKFFWSLLRCQTVCLIVIALDFKKSINLINNNRCTFNCCVNHLTEFQDFLDLSIVQFQIEIVILLILLFLSFFFVLFFYYFTLSLEISF